MKHIFNRKLNNKGTSLVELIVALLIFTVLFGSVYMGFNLAAKASVKNKNALYSETAAENIMEAVKAIGPDATSISRSMGWAMSPVSADDDNKSYWVPNYAEGTEVYDIKLTLNPTEYDAANVSGDSGANTYKFAKMSAFSDETAVTIFPGIGGMDFDTRAAGDFYDEHVNWMAAKWTEAYEEAYNIYLTQRAIYDAYEDKTGKVEPVFSPPSQDAYKPMELSAINNIIRRETFVEVTEVDSVNKEYTFSSKVVYSLDNGANGSLGVVQSVDPLNPRVEKEYGDYFNSETKYKGTESIYLMYTPYKSSVTATTVNFGDINSERINIKNNSSRASEMNLFIVIQNNNDHFEFGPSDSLSVITQGNASSMTFYSQAKLSNIQAEKQFKDGDGKYTIVEDMSKTLERVYTVTVEVYEHKDSHDDTETPFATLSSTVMKELDK